MEKIRLNADKWNDRFVINFFRIICVIEVILIGYFNLIKLRYYCEYDSSSYFLKAYEMYRQRTLFISDWVDQTSLKERHMTGLHYNPITNSFKLGPGVDVNYMLHTQNK